MGTTLVVSQETEDSGLVNSKSLSVFLCSNRCWVFLEDLLIGGVEVFLSKCHQVHFRDVSSHSRGDFFFPFKKYSQRNKLFLLSLCLKAKKTQLGILVSLWMSLVMGL